MRFMFRRRRKRKYKQVTLRDLKKDFDKNGEYRYAIVSSETRKPCGIAKTYKAAMKEVESSWKYSWDPLYAVDLLYWKG